MSSNVDSERELIIQLSREIIGETLPEEIPVFEKIALEYTEQSSSIQEGEILRSEDILGLSVAEMAKIISPAVMAMVSSVMVYLRKEVLKTLQEGGTEALKDRIKGLFAKDDQGRGEISIEQLERIRQVAYEQALMFGIDPDQAKLMADSLIGKLALMK